MPTVAIIGSFRKHYSLVLAAHRVFVAAGLKITSPLGAPPIGSGTEEFVRFTSDRADWSEEMIETVALHRILRADVTYVIAPDGYVGRTTAYEIGRAIQAARPIVFSELPLDIPLGVSDSSVMTPEELVAALAGEAPPPLHETFGKCRAALEEALVHRDYRAI